MSRRFAGPTLACAMVSLAFAVTAFADPTGAAWTKEAIGWTGIFRMATAPFPHPSRSFTDDRVMFFVPAGFRSSDKVSLVIHYHGHRNEIVNSDKGHRYREQFALSRKNAVLVQPQGPLNASDSAGGKHSDANGLKRFVAEVLTVLARENVVPTGATLGKLVLSGHSGAYQVIGRELAQGGVPVDEVDLHDALYGEMASFETWAKGAGHKLVSTYTRNGGTAANNESLRLTLQAAGLAVATNDEEATLASSRTLILRTDVAHDPVTYQRLRWAEVLKHSSLPDLSVPQPRLRSVRGVAAGTVEVSWYPVRSSLLRGYRLYASPDPTGPFTLVQNEQVLGAALTSSKVVTGTDKVFRVAAVDDRGQESPPSNVYQAQPDGETRTKVLVVDGFTRTSGAWKSYDHALAALAGESIRAAARPFDTCRASAVTDGSVKLADYASVVWLSGDQSLEDAALTRDEQKAVTSYLVRGGTLLIAGSELGYALGTASGSPEDRAFFSGTLHAAYAADSTPSRTASGASPSFAGLSVAFGGATAAYPVRTPDVLAAGTGGVVAVRYADGRAAAIAYEGLVGAATAKSGVLTVGFPPECIDGAPGRDAFFSRALEWLDGVNRRAGR